MRSSPLVTVICVCCGECDAAEQAQFKSEPKEKTTWKVVSASDFLSSRPCRSCRLLDDVKLDLCDTASNHSQRFGRSVGNVNNPSADVRTAVIDANRHGLPTGDVRYAQPGAEWQRGMGGRQFVRIELLTGRGLCSFRVEAGDPIRCDLCPGGSFVRCERSVPSCDRHAPFWRSIVFLGRLATWRDHFGFIGGNMGLCAGRKRGRTETNGNARRSEVQSPS
jgi:hypothetical protein